MNTPLPLTIVTAVLNEEKNLHAFLKHAKSIAQEVMVIVDYRTTDTSEQTAKDAGCKVLRDRGESKGIVFNNKNRGIREASHEWILILDADERLDDTFQKELEEIVLHNPHPRVNYYQTGFINYEFGKYFDACDQKHKKFIRLFRKGTFEYQTGKTAEGFGIHTQGLGNSVLLKIPGLRTWAISQNPEIKNLKGYIIHHSHPTIKDFLRKINHYSTREARILFEQNENPNAVALTAKLFFNPLREFIQKYIFWKMYKEGAHGAVASILYSFYHFLIVTKVLLLRIKRLENRSEI